VVLLPISLNRSPGTKTAVVAGRVATGTPKRRRQPEITGKRSEQHHRWIFIVNKDWKILFLEQSR